MLKRKAQNVKELSRTERILKRVSRGYELRPARLPSFRAMEGENDCRTIGAKDGHGKELYVMIGLKELCLCEEGQEGMERVVYTAKNFLSDFHLMRSGDLIVASTMDEVAVIRPTERGPYKKLKAIRTSQFFSSQSSTKQPQIRSIRVGASEDCILVRTEHQVTKLAITENDIALTGVYKTETETHHISFVDLDEKRRKVIICQNSLRGLQVVSRVKVGDLDDIAKMRDLSSDGYLAFGSMLLLKESHTLVCKDTIGSLIRFFNLSPDFDSFQLEATIEAHTYKFYAPILLHERRQLLFLGLDSKLFAINLVQKQVIAEFEVDGLTHSMLLTGDEEKLIVSSRKEKEGNFTYKLHALHLTERQQYQLLTKRFTVSAIERCQTNEDVMYLARNGRELCKFDVGTGEISEPIFTADDDQQIRLIKNDVRDRVAFLKIVLKVGTSRLVKVSDGKSELIHDFNNKMLYSMQVVRGGKYQKDYLVVAANASIGIMVYDIDASEWIFKKQLGSEDDQLQ